MRSSLLIVGLLISVSGYAQMAMSARDSDFDITYLGGSADNPVGGSASNSDENLYASSGAGLVGTPSENGVSALGPWGYTVGFNLAHSYQITPSLIGATRIQAQGTSNISTTTTGAILSTRSNLPGNRLRLTFTLATPRLFKLKADVQSSSFLAGSTVTLYAGTPGSSQAYWLVSNVNANILQFRNLGAGTYMLEAECTGGTNGADISMSSFKYDFEQVATEVGGLNAVIQGRIQIADHIPNLENESVQLEIYSLSGNLLATRTTVCNAIGEFGMPVPSEVGEGFYNIRLRGDSTIRKLVGLVYLSNNQVNSIGTWTLINGDIDADGEVGPGDFESVVASFGDSGENLPADVDGDGEVGPGDFENVVNHFGMADE